MALIVNEAFWLFFFMIGFVGTVDCLVDFAPVVLKCWWRPKFAASLVVAAELLVVLMLTWVLRYFNTTSALTGSVIRNAALLYTATRLSDRKVHAVMLVPTWFLFWPRAGWQPWAMIDDYRVRLSQLQVMREEPTRRLTVSIGISRIKDADEVLKDFIDRTDIKLYAAKRGGRDRVVQSETGD